MMVVFSIAFTSCGNDDEDDDFVKNGSQIEINGKKHNVFDTSLLWCDMVALYGETMMKGLYGDNYLEQNTAMCSIDTSNGDSYLFSWVSPYEPKKGDVISKMKDFVMEPDIIGQKKDIEYSYGGGTAKIIDTNVSKEEMTIQFDNLKMVKGSDSFSFTGQLTFPFDYSELH